MAIWGAVAGAVIVGGANLIGSSMSGGGGGGGASSDAVVQEARLAREQMIARLDKLSIPQLQALIPQLKKYDINGVLMPLLANYEKQRRSELGDIKEDPALRGAQIKALAGITDIAEEGGITPEERAQQAEILGLVDAKARGAREAETTQAQRTGTYGSGIDFINRSVGNQSAYDQAYQASLQTEAQARGRKLSALKMMGEQGGAIRGQDWNQKSQVAEANDIINNFNTSNANKFKLVNNALINDRINRKQGLTEANVVLTNQQEMARVNAVQQDFNNRFGVATGANNATAQGTNSVISLLNNQLTADTNRANQTNQFMGSLLGVAGTIGGAYITTKYRPVTSTPVAG